MRRNEDKYKRSNCHVLLWPNCAQRKRDFTVADRYPLVGLEQGVVLVVGSCLYPPPFPLPGGRRAGPQLFVALPAGRGFSQWLD